MTLLQPAAPSPTPPLVTTFLTISSISTTAPEVNELEQVCGYIDHDFEKPYTCDGSATCLWNSRLSLAGCGTPTSITYFTSCIPSWSSENCNEACQADPSILRCGTTAPFCATLAIGPRGRYSMLTCQTAHHHDSETTYLTYAGQNSIAHLPRYLGDDGTVTYATQTPKPGHHDEPSEVMSTVSPRKTTETESLMRTSRPAFRRHRRWIFRYLWVVSLIAVSAGVAMLVTALLAAVYTAITMEDGAVS